MKGAWEMGVSAMLVFLLVTTPAAGAVEFQESSSPSAQNPAKLAQTTAAQITATEAEGGTYFPGETVAVDVTVENTGDTSEEFYVDASIQRPNGNWVTGEGTTVSLDPGESKSLTLDVGIPDDATEGTYSAGSGVFQTSAKDERYDYGQDLDSFRVESPSTDAQIVDTTADGGTYQPGDAVPIDITIENTGDTSHDFYVDASVQRPNGNWVTGEGTTVSLSPGETDTVTLDGHIPDDAQDGTWSAGSGVFNSSDKDDRYAYGQDLDSFTVEEPTTDARITQTVAESGTYRPGDNVPVEVTVENTGDTTHEFYVDASVQRPNGDWVTGESTSLDLSPGETTTVFLDAQIPTDAQDGTWSAGSGVFHSSAKDNRYAYGQDLDSFIVEEPTTDARITRTVAEGGTYRPGDRVPVEVTIENTGDTTHDFYVDASIQRPNGDWVTGEDSTVGLSPGESRTVWLDVTIPEDASSGTFSAGAGVFHSGDKDNRYGSGQDLDAFTVEEPTTTARITRTVAEGGTYSPGEQVPVEVTIENTGDTTHDFYVDASIQRPNGDWITGEDTSVYLSPGETDTVSLAATVPADARDGTWSAGAGVFHSSDKDDRYAYEQDLDSFTVEEPTANARITRTVAEGGTYSPGEAVPIDVTIENTGDRIHDFYVDASVQRPNGNWVTGESTTLDLSPGETEIVTLDAQVPNDVSSGTFSAGAGVFHSSDKDDRYDSSQDLDAFTVERQTTNARITQTVAEGGTYSPGEDVPVEVIVENTGDRTHDFYVDASIQRPNGDWVTGEDSSVYLSPGETESVTLDVAIPDDASSGTFSAGAGVFHSGDKDNRYGSGQDLNSFEVTEANEPPSADRKSSHSDQSITVGDSIEFRVAAEDADSNLEGAEWYVNGELVESSQSINGSSDTTSMSQSFESEGTYTVEATVFDSAQSYSSSVEWEVTVKLTGSPEISIKKGGWSPPQPKQDETLSFTAEIKNSGSVPAEDSQLEVIIDGEQVATKEVGRITPGETVSIDQVGAYIVDDDESQVVFAVTASDGTGERVELAQFERTMSPTGSPLEVTSPEPVDSYQTYGDSLTQSVEVTNPGETTQTVNFRPVVTRVADSTQKLGEQREITLRPGETTTVAVKWPTDAVSRAGLARLSLQQLDGNTVIATDRVSTVSLTATTSKPTVTVENGLTGEPVDSADIKVTVLGVNDDVKLSLGSTGEISATQTGPGRFRLDQLPDGTLVQVSATRPGYHSPKSAFFVGSDTSPHYVELTPKTQTVVQVETWSGETVTDLSVSINGETYETNANGIIRLGERTVGAELEYEIQGSNEKPYLDQGTFRVPTDGVPRIRVEKLEEPSSAPDSDGVFFGRELYEDGTVPGDSRTARVETALTDLSERGYTSDELKLLFIREDGGVLAVVVNPALWEQYRDERAYEILPYADTTAGQATIASLRFRENTEKVFRRGMREAWAGYLEGSERAVSPDDEINNVVGKSQGVYIDRQSPAYITARGISVFAGSGVGEAREGWRESNAGQFAVEGGFLLADFTPVTAAASKTGKVGKLAKGTKGKVFDTVGRALARGGTSGKLVKRASPKKLAPVIKRVDETSGQDEAYDAVRRYYDDKGGAASKLVKSGTLTERQVVEAARKGMDLRETRKLKQTHGMSDEAIQRLVRYDIRPADTRAVIDEGALATEDIESLTRRIEQNNRLQKYNWQGMMADANTMKSNDAFRKFMKEGWDDRDELTFMQMIKRDDIADSKIKGAIGEIRTAAWYGPENVKDMSRTVADGEIDIVLRGNRYVEVKNKKRVKSNKLEKQIETYKQYADGGDVEVHLYDTRKMTDENILTLKTTLGSKPGIEIKQRPGSRNTIKQSTLDAADSPSIQPMTPKQMQPPSTQAPSSAPAVG